MAIAIALAAKVRPFTSPNPWVGCVIQAANEDIFGGATEPPGGRHAEIVALHAAADAARGSTVYTTLEPCSHIGRTGPCADALIKAGVHRVVVGVLDPDVQVAGRGLTRLRDAGIDVSLGVCAELVNEQLAPYLHHRRTGRPWVVLKLASTLDGRTAAADGSSQWITGAEARRDAHRLRAESDAILVGAGTVRADDPALTVRLDDGVNYRDPRRIVLGAAPPEAKVHPCLEWSGGLPDLLDRLGREGVVQLMVEGGARVAQSFHESGLVNRYVLYLAPALLGDRGRSLLTGGGNSMADIWRGDIVDTRRVGSDLRVEVSSR